MNPEELLQTALKGQSTLNNYTKPEKGYSPGVAYQPDPSTTLEARDVSIKDLKTFPEYNVDMRFGQPDWFDQRAQNQSTGEQLWNGLFIRGLGTTFTKVMSGVGHVGGFIGWAGTGFKDISTMTDNGFSAYFDGLEQTIKDDLAPIYKPSYVQNGGFWDNVSSLSFWMDDGVDGAAFLASALIPGIGISKVAQLGSRVANIIGKGAKIAQKIDEVAITAFNTISESAVEAKGVQDRVRQELQYKVDQGLMTQEQLETKAAEAARNNFIMNAILLSGTNMVQTKMFFGNAKNTAERSVLNKIVDDKGNILDAGPITKNLIAKNLLKESGKSIINEGFEEGAQLAIENTVVQDKTDDPNKKNLLENFGENFTTTEGQLAMFLGSVMGMVGGAVSTYKKSKAEKAAIENAQSKLTKLDNTYTANLKQLLKSIYVTEVVDGVEQYKKDDQGNLIVDMTKRDALAQKLEELGDIETYKQVALLNKDPEKFEYLQNLTFGQLAVEHLQYGEGSLEVLNKRIDNMAEQNKKEYEEIFGAIGQQDIQSIDKVKEQQKKIAEAIYNTLQTQKDFAGVWDVSSEQPKFKDKNELRAYDAFVQEAIGRKAIADGQIKFLDYKIEESSKQEAEANATLENLNQKKEANKTGLAHLNDILELHKKESKSLTEEEKELKKKYSKSELEDIIKDTEEEIKETEKEIKEATAKRDNLKKVTKEYKEKRNEWKEAWGNYSNKTLHKKVNEEWEKTKKEAETKKEEIQKAAEEAKAKQEKEENKDSNTPKKTNTERERLLKRKEELEANLTSLLDIEGADEEQIKQAKEELSKIERQLEKINSGTPANQAREEEIKNIPVVEYKKGDLVTYKGDVYKVEDVTNGNVIVKFSDASVAIPFSEVKPATAIDLNPQEIISQTMTEDKSLNQEGASFKEPEVLNNSKLNTVIYNDEIGQSHGVVMHTQLQHTKFKLSNGVKIFYFNSDENGNPIPENQSGVEFDLVNDPEALTSGSTVTYEEVTLSEAQTEDNKKNIDRSIQSLKELKKQGFEISEDNNWGFGDPSKAIAVFAKDSAGNKKLVGFYPLPKSPSPNSESLQTLLATRNLIIEERKAINDKLKDNKEVETQVRLKGVGNVYTRRLANGKPDFTDIENSSVFISDKQIESNHIDNKPVFAYYNESTKTWVVPTDTSDRALQKQYNTAQIQASAYSGKNGQVAMLVKTANNTWAPIPVYSNKQTPETLKELREILEEVINTPGITAKDAISRINHLVYASMDSSKSDLRIYDADGEIKFFVDGTSYTLSKIKKDKDAFYSKLGNLKQNITGLLNSDIVQARMKANNTLVTNVHPVNGRYFVQPFIQLKSIVAKTPDTTIKEAKQKDSQKVKDNNKTNLTTLLEAQTKEGYIEKPTENRNTYKINGEEYQRVSNYAGLSLDKETAEKPAVKLQTNLGSRVDNFLKDFLQKIKLTNEQKVTISAEDLKEILGNNEKFTESFGDKSVDVTKKFLTFFKPYVLAGAKFHTNVVVWGTDNNGVKVAGEIDLLIEHKDGKLELVDLKTFTTKTVDNFTKEYEQGKSKAISTGKQLTVYNILLNNTFGLSTSTQSLLILPTRIDIENTLFPKVDFVGELEQKVPFLTDSVENLSYNKTNSKTTKTKETNTSNQPSQVKSDSNDIEAKKVDIGRRRQELESSREIETLYDLTKPITEDSKEIISKIEEANKLRKEAKVKSEQAAKETNEEKRIALNSDSLALAEKAQILDKEIKVSRDNVINNTLIKQAITSAKILGQKLLNKIKLAAKSNEWVSSMPISKEEFTKLEDATKRLSVKGMGEVTSNSEVIPDILLVEEINAKYDAELTALDETNTDSVVENRKQGDLISTLPKTTTPVEDNKGGLSTPSLTTSETNVNVESTKVMVNLTNTKRVQLTVTNTGEVLNADGSKVTDKKLIHNALYALAESKDLGIKLPAADGPKSVKVFVDITNSMTDTIGSIKFIYLDGNLVPEEKHLEIVKRFPDEIKDLKNKIC